MYINDEQKKYLCKKEKLNKLRNNRFSCLAFYVKSVLQCKVLQNIATVIKLMIILHEMI